MGRAAARARRASPDPALHQHRGDRYAGVALRVARGSARPPIGSCSTSKPRRRSVCRAARPARVAHEVAVVGATTAETAQSPARPRRSRRRRHGCPVGGGSSRNRTSPPAISCSRSRRTRATVLEKGARRRRRPLHALRRLPDGAGARRPRGKRCPRSARIILCSRARARLPVSFISRRRYAGRDLHDRPVDDGGRARSRDSP